MLLRVLREVDVSLVFVVMLDVFQVDDHVQSIGQDQQQDEGSDEAHQNRRCEEKAQKQEPTVTVS